MLPELTTNNSTNKNDQTQQEACQQLVNDSK